MTARDTDEIEAAVVERIMADYATIAAAANSPEFMAHARSHAQMWTKTVLAALGLEQVGWLHDADTLDPAPVKMNQGSGAFYVGEVGITVPIYRLRPASVTGRSGDAS